MEAASSRAEAVARLDAVRTRTRELLSGRRWLKDTFRHSVEQFDLLCRGFRAQKAERLAAEYDLARTLLKSGRYIDPTATNPEIRVRFEGLCPAALATKLEGQRLTTMSRPLEKKVAAAALIALEHHILFQSGDTSEQVRDQMAEATRAAVEAGSHVRYSWRVDMDRPHEWVLPADPHSVEQKHLSRFLERDYRAIAMYRLSGLVDVGSSRPIVPKPSSRAGGVSNTSAYLLWRFRLPVEDEFLESESPVLDPDRFPPLLAEEMLEIVTAWVVAQEGDPSQQAPLERLRRAVRVLRPVLGNVTLFREISEQRAEQRKSRVALANKLGARSFASFEEAAKSAQLASDLVGQVSPEPADFINQLRHMLESGIQSCEIASVAIREGGADLLDDALNPGAKGRSVAWAMKVREAESLLWSLAMAIGVPGALFADDVERMLTLGEWFANAAAELEAVVAVSSPTPSAAGAHPVLEGGALRVTTERAGSEKRASGSGEREPLEQVLARIEATPLDAMFSAGSLASTFGVSRWVIAKRLERWRTRNALGGDWIEHDARAKQTARFRYRFGAIKHIVIALVRAASVSHEMSHDESAVGK